MYRDDKINLSGSTSIEILFVDAWTPDQWEEAKALPHGHVVVILPPQLPFQILSLTFLLSLRFSRAAARTAQVRFRGDLDVESFQGPLCRTRVSFRDSLQSKKSLEDFRSSYMQLLA
jgi:hypothetical protein